MESKLKSPGYARKRRTKFSESFLYVYISNMHFIIGNLGYKKEN